MTGRRCWCGRGVATSYPDAIECPEHDVPPTDPRCERTDLPTSMCAHCRGHKDPAAPTDLSSGDVLSRFTARFDGRCENCDGAIATGDTIAALADGSGYACEGCLP